MPTKIILGKEYGWLTVDATTEKRDYRGRTLYRCVCRCGGVRLVASDRLLAGNVISCGCAQKKARAQIGGSKERRGWTLEEDAARIAKRMTGCKGIYQRGKSFIAQIKIQYRTYYIGSYRTEEDAIRAREAVVRMRITEGDDAAIALIQRLRSRLHR